MLKIPILAALISLQSANYIPKIEKEILSILSEQTTNKEKIESEPTLQDFVPKTVFV
jgi:hypothetical protein